MKTSLNKYNCATFLKIREMSPTKRVEIFKILHQIHKKKTKEILFKFNLMYPFISLFEIKAG